MVIMMANLASANLDVKKMRFEKRIFILVSYVFSIYLRKIE
jgi:hypothetical protein